VRGKAKHSCSSEEARYSQAKLSRMKCAEGRVAAWGARIQELEATY